MSCLFDATMADSAGTEPSPGKRAPDPELDTVIVTAERQSSPAPEATMDGDELRRKSAATLGETLGEEPGVHNASFGPGVGLPVIRGFSGSRVRLMQGGIGAHDVSSMSPDHATSIEAALADRITVVRGPATLRYGGNAIGGAVDVADNRIPSRLPPAPLTGSAELRGGTNGWPVGTAGRLDAGQGSVATHIHGFARQRNDVEIPGQALDEAALTARFGPDERANSDGVILNSDSRAWGGTAGASRVGSRGHAGLAISTLSNDYGVPAGSHSHGGGQALDVRIEIDQLRLDFGSALDFQTGPVSSMELRVGYVDFQLDEREADRAGTRFSNEAVEARLELNQAPGRWLTGSAGFQWVSRDFSALGAEAFVPPSELESIGAYLLESATWEAWELELAVRGDWQTVRQLEPIACQGLGLTLQRSDSEHRNLSYAGALERSVSGGVWRLALTRAQRAPDIQELLSCGAHLGTKSYDLAFSFDGTGTGLSQETFRTADAGFSWSAGRQSGEFTVFYSDIRNYIYQRNVSDPETGPFFNPERGAFQGRCTTGDECFSIYQYTQEDARFLGLEAQADVLLLEDGARSLSLGIFGDLVRAELDGGDEVPRIPPLRVGVRVDFDQGPWSAEARLSYGAKQDRVGRNEQPTDAYFLLNGSVGYRLRRERYAGSVLLKGRNLLNEEIRNATSFLRDYAPEPGRALELAVGVEW